MFELSVDDWIVTGDTSKAGRITRPIRTFRLPTTIRWVSVPIEYLSRSNTPRTINKETSAMKTNWKSLALMGGIAMGCFAAGTSPARARVSRSAMRGPEYPSESTPAWEALAPVFTAEVIPSSRPLPSSSRRLPR